MINATETKITTSTVRPLGIRPTDEDVRSHFADLLYRAVRKREPARIVYLAGLAADGRWVEAARPLSDFLVPPSKKWASPKTGRRGWTEARVAAVQALEEMDVGTAHHALVYTLACESDCQVRLAANRAIRKLGSAAIGPMAMAIREQINWNVDGMRALLTAFGDRAEPNETERRIAGMALMEVLYENYPLAPRRWTRYARRLGQMVSALSTTLLTAQFMFSDMPLIAAVILAAPLGMLAGFCATAVASIASRAACSRKERAVLNAVAAQSIIRLNDPRSIPGMLQLAFDGPPRAIASNARTVLIELLPHVSETDAGLFGAFDIECMNGAIGKPLQPALAVALLHALSCVGNAASIRRVARFAKRARNADVRDAAVAALEALKLRDARLKQARN
ncbi:MAG TPA: hypothetical protein VKT77_21265, partial [Chthonomonadaceae bacterium]|nr:hypothetical protein [Chthonomonadaceae bacterium]